MDARKELYRALLSGVIFTSRRNRNLSQEGMAELLRISPRSYIDLEHGKFCCSGPILLTFLYQVPEKEVQDLIQEFHSKLLEL